MANPPETRLRPGRGQSPALTPWQREVPTRPQFCATCGFPDSAGMICPACGADRHSGPRFVDEIDSEIVGRDGAEDYPELAAAFAAHEHRDYIRMITSCLQGLGVEQPRLGQFEGGAARGQRWAFFYESAAIYIALDLREGSLSIDSPVVRIPKRQRVALMRTLLEIGETTLGVSRFCVRGDLVVLRYTESVEYLTPPKVLAVVREVALLADHFDDILALAFDTIRVGPRARRSRSPWEQLGTPQRIPMLSQQMGVKATPRVDLAPEFGPASATGGARRLEPLAGRHLELEHERREQALGEAERRTLARQRLRGMVRILQGLDAVELDGVIRGLICRSAFFTFVHCFGDDYPRAANYVLDSVGRTALESLPEGRRTLFSVRTELKPEFAPLTLLPGYLQRIMAEDFRVDGAEHPLSLASLPTALEAKNHLRQILNHMNQEGRLPDDATYMILLGALHEMLVRVRLPPAMAQKLQEVTGTAMDGGSTPVTRSDLQLAVERVLG